MKKTTTLTALALCATACSTTPQAAAPSSEVSTASAASAVSAAGAAPAAAPQMAAVAAAEAVGAPRAAGQPIQFPYVETFEGLEDGAAPFGWVVKGDAKSTATITSAAAGGQVKSGTSALHLSDDSPQDSAEVSTVIGAQKKGMVAYSLLVSDDRPGDAYMTVGVGSNSAGRVVDVVFSKGGNLRYRGDSGELIDIRGYGQGEWHDVNVVWDVEQGKFWLNVDGSLIGDFPIVQPVNPTHVTFKVGSNKKFGQSAFIDDVRIAFE